MKVALITNLCTHYRYKLFKLLADKYNFDLYFFDEEGKTKEDIKHLAVFKNHPKFYYFRSAKIIKILLKSNYDVIVKCTNNKWLFLATFIISKLKRAKFIVWHSIWYYPKTFQYRFFSWIFVYLLKHWADAIVVYGEHGKRFLMDKGIDQNKIFIAWQTVDNELYEREIEEKEMEKIKNALNTDEKKVILYVGRLKKLKGIEYLLEALNSLNKDRFIFVAVGDGELKDYISEFCRINNINFRLTGLIPYHDLPPYYRIATLLVLPSITTKTFKEPWGLVVNEAFNQGCPVVVTDAVGAGVGGLVKDEENGFVVPEKDVYAMANAIDKIINDDELRQKMSLNAKEEIKKWTYERQAKGFLDAVECSLKER